MGLTKKGNYVTAANAKPGDKIILTKTAGIEGTAILASDREKELKKTLRNADIKNAKDFWLRISVVKEALTAFKSGGVHAMHDPTEGGVAGGLHEIADASGVGLEVFWDKISVANETSMICKHFEIDPIQLIGSGALLIAADSSKTQEILESLKKENIQAKEIGEFVKSPTKRVIFKNDKQRILPRPTSDHLWKALSRK